MSLEQQLRESARKGLVSATAALLKKGADVNAAEEVDGWTPLHFAANGNSTAHFECAMELLSEGANVNAQNSEGETPLHLAALKGDMVMVDGLLNFDADKSIRDNRGRTPYFVAIQHFPSLAVKINPDADSTEGRIFGRTETGLEAVKGVGEEKREIEERNKAEQELRDAAEEGDLLTVTELIEINPEMNLDAVDDQGNSALSLATFHNRPQVVRELLENGASPTIAHSELLQTPLHVAAERGFVTVVHELLPKLGEDDINSRDKDGRTALFVAAMEGHGDVIQALLEGDADANILDKEGKSPLFVAADESNVEAVKVLLDNLKSANSTLEIDTPDVNGFSPLHAAARNGNILIAREILDRGGDVEAENSQGETPLFLAANAGESQLLKLLLEDYDADVNTSNFVGETPLYVAAISGHAASVKVLIDNGADTEAAAKGGFTPLMASSQEGQIAVMSKLLENGANVQTANNFGETALLIASLEGYTNAVGLLLENGADLKSAQNEGKTALHLASRDGHVGVVGVLLAASKKLDESKLTGTLKFTPVHLTADTKGETALHSAVRFGHVSVVELLLNHDEQFQVEESVPQNSVAPTANIYGPLVDAQNKFGWTPLHVAADNQQREALTALLRHHASINPSDKFGLKPLHLACRRRDQRIVLDLLDIPGIDVSGETLDGLTPLHFASACVRPNAIAAVLKSGGDVRAPDKSGRHSIDVLSNEPICNPLIEGMCVNLGTNTSVHFAGDLCPVAIGGANDKAESNAILMRAMNRTGTPVVIEPAKNDTGKYAPTRSTSGGSSRSGDEISLPMFATLVPMLGIVLCLIAAMFLLARRRRHLDNGGSAWSIGRQPHHRRHPAQGHGGGSSKVDNAHKTPRNSPRTAESPLNDNHFMVVQRNMPPLDLEEGNSSQLNGVGYVDSIEDESSGSDDGSCMWSDGSDDCTPRTNALRRASRHSAIEGTSNRHEIRVARTISKSSSDGEMQEREKRDAVGPLPPVRAPKNKFARGWLVGRSRSGRRLIGLRGGGSKPQMQSIAAPDALQPVNMITRHPPNQINRQGSGSMAATLELVEGSTLVHANSASGSTCNTVDEYQSRPSCEMQRQWSWS